MIEFGYTICTILMFVLLIVCMVAEIVDAFNPKMHVMDTIRPIVFAATLAMMPVIFHFFGLFIDYDYLWAFLKDIPELFGEMFNMFRGCVLP